MSPGRHEFTADEIQDLLSELDRRLKDRGVAASVFLVGGAAIALPGRGSSRRTEDVDVITGNSAVLEEARNVAADRGVPMDWLNSRRKDVDDIIDLSRRLGLNKPSPADLEAIIRRRYTDEGALEFILDDASDIDGEIRYLSEAAARFLADTRPPRCCDLLEQENGTIVHLSFSHAFAGGCPAAVHGPK